MVPPRPCTPPEVAALRALSGGAVRDARRMPDGRYLHTNEHGLEWSTDRRLVDEYLVAMRPKDVCCRCGKWLDARRWVEPRTDRHPVTFGHTCAECDESSRPADATDGTGA